MKNDSVNSIPPSEKDFIRVFSQVFQFKNKALLSGSEFDDCAAIRLNSFCNDLNGESLTFSTDTVRESSDFPSGMTAWQKGWMAAAVNLSDLAAMGSKPVAFLFSAGLPANFSLEDAENLASGIQECVSFFGAEVIGGDTERCDELTITGTVIGISENKSLLLRKNAKPDDLLCLTGFSGSAGVALSVLLNEISLKSDSAFVSQSSKDLDSFLKNLTEPFPRVFEGIMLSELAKTSAVTSMIDTSDGLASSIYELSSLSGVCFEIDAQSLPLDDKALKILSNCLIDDENNSKNHENARRALIHEALYTGGDFELLFTISPDKLNDIKEIFENFNLSADNDYRLSTLSSSGKSGRFPCKFTVIGKAIAESENVILTQSDFSKIRQPLLKKGYDSFKKYI